MESRTEGARVTSKAETYPRVVSEWTGRDRKRLRLVSTRPDVFDVESAERDGMGETSWRPTPIEADPFALACRCLFLESRIAQLERERDAPEAEIPPFSGAHVTGTYPVKVVGSYTRPVPSIEEDPAPAAEPRAVDGMPTWENLRDRYMGSMLRVAAFTDDLVSKSNAAWIDVHAWLVSKLSGARPDRETLAKAISASWSEKHERLGSYLSTEAASDAADAALSLFPLLPSDEQGARDADALDEIAGYYERNGDTYGFKDLVVSLLRSTGRLQEPRT